MANKRQRKKNAKTKQRKGTLYKPNNRNNRMIAINGVDIDPNNKYQQSLLTTAEFNLFQLNSYMYDRIELEAVDIDTLKWLASVQFLKIIDDIRNWARYDPNYYRKSNYKIAPLISKKISEYFKPLNHASSSRIIKIINRAHKEMRTDIQNDVTDKHKHDNPFIVVYYSDMDK